MTFIFVLRPSDFVLCAFFLGTTNVEKRLEELEKDVKRLKVQKPEKGNLAGSIWFDASR